jgi:hypothetical protein
MAVDASIYSQIAQPRPVNRLAQYANVAQIQGLQQQNALASMKMDEMRRASEDDQALRADLAAPGADPYNALLKRGRIKEANEFQKGQTERKRTEVSIAKDELEMGIKRAEYGASVLSLATDQTSYDRVRQVLGSTFGEKAIAQMPPQFDPAYVQAEVTKGMTRKQQLEEERARQQQAETARHNRTTEANSAGQLRVSQGNLDLRKKEFDLNSGNAVAEAGGPSQVALTKQFGKAPPGYRWRPDGSQEAIPGGPAQAKSEEQKRQQESGVATVAANLSVIDKALTHPGRETATGLSSAMDPRNFVPGTDAADFRAVLDQIGGTAFLQAFESLKGGGQITQIEGEKATAAIARLSRAQSDEEFENSLRELRDVMAAGYKRLSGKEFDRPAPGRKGGPKPGTVQDGFKFKGGNPADPKNWEKV